MKKIFCLLLFVILIAGENCFAGKVTSSGRGITRDAALHNAMRAAIETELGAFVDSRTLMKNRIIINDEVSVNSSGYISGYEIISEHSEGDLYFVKIIAEVNSDAVRTGLMSRLQKKNLVDTNFDSPRIAVLVYDSFGREYPNAENEIISALSRQGFTGAVDLKQVNRSTRQRMIAAANEPELLRSLANDFHVDYFVLSEVKISGRRVNLASRMLNANTGKILYAGNSSGGTGMFAPNSLSVATNLAAKKAGYEISRAALNAAAQIEHRISILITPETFSKFGGAVGNVQDRLQKISGMKNVFVRRAGTSAEVDADFDGTAADLAAELEREGFKILDVRTGFIKI